MALKMKFNSCKEAERFWQSDWRQCPVCGEHIKLINPFDNDHLFIPVHKKPKYLIN